MVFLKTIIALIELLIGMMPMALGFLSFLVIDGFRAGCSSFEKLNKWIVKK